MLHKEAALRHGVGSEDQDFAPLRFTMAPLRISDGDVNDLTYAGVSDVEIAKLQSDMIEPIALIDLGLKLPQDAATSRGCFEMLKECRSALTEIPGAQGSVQPRRFLSP